ncbi:unnamed protein product [Brachionus calyciflorus]|uniref:MULE transposase domain-containing protein n=1 Tax=Brachionus calyciflorus TaxID=104777 RepID=A0A813VQY9_9BILA|nr:unnamed protein product [Brachionus calyciflorus]
MNQEILLIDQDAKQIIFQNYLIQVISNNHDIPHLDGTFKTRPTHFHQILSIHGYYQNQMFPAGYILLQNKERETYIDALTQHLPLEDIEKRWTNILDNIPKTPDQDTIKFIKYFVDTWLRGKYEFFWNHFDNTGPRTNNHLEGYHAKLSAIPSAKTSNVLTFINMIKKSATQVFSDFHTVERNPIEEQKQLSKNKKKDYIFLTLQDQYTKKIITFEQYFEKLAAHITDPYGTSQMKFDHDLEEREEEKIGKKRKIKKIVFDNPLKTNDFLNRIDFIKFEIRKIVEQPSDLFSKDLFTILKSQIHIYNNYIVKDQPSEPVDFQEPKAKKIKSDASDDIYYLETRSHSNHERVRISKSLLELTHNQELNN